MRACLGVKAIWDAQVQHHLPLCQYAGEACVPAGVIVPTILVFMCYCSLVYQTEGFSIYLIPVFLFEGICPILVDKRILHHKESLNPVYYTAIKHSRNLGTLEKC